MKYRLIKPVNQNYSALEQILTNRGIKRNEIEHYINTTDDDINSFEILGGDRLSAAAKAILKTVRENRRCMVIVDCDVDGYTSAALLINYLHKLFPS